MKAPSIGIILGKPKMGGPKDEDEEDDKGDDGGDEDLHEQGKAAAEDFIAAQKAGDPAKLWDAFVAMDHCSDALMHGEGDEDEDEEEEK